MDHGGNAKGANVPMILVTISGALIVAAIAGMFGWLVNTSQAISAHEERITANSNRITALENGRSTPMSQEARAEFSAVRQRLDQIERRLDETAGAVRSLEMRRFK